MYKVYGMVKSEECKGESNKNETPVLTHAQYTPLRKLQLVN